MKKDSLAKQNENRLNHFLQENGLQKHNIQFWGHEFGYYVNDTKKEVTPYNFKLLECYNVIGLTKNYSFIVINTKTNKKMWVKREFWESSTSPRWYDLGNFAVYVRIGFNEKDIQQNIVASFLAESIDNQNSGKLN